MILYKCDICNKDSQIKTFITYVRGAHRCHECIMSAIIQCKHDKFTIPFPLEQGIHMQKTNGRCVECERNFNITVILSRPE